MPIYDDDIARIKADVLHKEANKIDNMAEHQTCKCGHAPNHLPDCPVAVFLRISRMLRMDAEG